jgi:hypothetical protein
MLLTCAGCWGAEGSDSAQPGDPGPGLDAASLWERGRDAAKDEDWATAFGHFEASLAAPFLKGTPVQGQDRMPARRGAIQALSASKPLDALHRVVELAQGHAAPDLFGGVAGDFRQAGCLDAAALATAMGLVAFPGDPGLKNPETRIIGETWQLMQADLGAIGYLRQPDSDPVKVLGLGDSYPSERQSFLELLDPITHKFILEQGYTD